VVERIRDGRSFSVRQVVASQAGLEVFRMALSFHIPEDGVDFHGSSLPEDVPAPDGIGLDYVAFTEDIRPATDGPWPGAARPMDVRYINPPAHSDASAITDSQKMWMRISEPLPDDRVIHDCALLYLSDATLVDHVWLPHGRRWQDGRAIGASLDHTMWFHRPVRADEWVLFDQQVENTGSTRGLAIGRFYTENEGLVATCGQEGLMRWNE
jgi:acyl-CoA thioesterase-2